MSVAFIPMTAESNAESLSDRRPGTLLFEMLRAQERGPFSPRGLTGSRPHGDALSCSVWLFSTLDLKV